MTAEKILIIYLSQFDLTNAKIGQILHFLGNNLTLKAFTNAQLSKNNLLKEDLYAQMKENADESLVRSYVLNIADRGIKITTKFDTDYPVKLRDLPDAPYILYYMGDISLANSLSLGVVGTRKPSNYGILATENLVGEIASNGITIVSGLAYGVDSIGHRKCLEVGGKTIAVLGGGFDHIYPAEHQSLAMEIAEKGLLLSEYRPKRKATKFTFPTRNRIIAGLSDGVLITEAGLKSGTIHTKDFALDYGRNIYAVPGSIFSQSSELTNEIIKTSQASIVTCGGDILKDYGVNPAKEHKKKVSVAMDMAGLSDDEKAIVSQLVDGEKSIEEITNLSKLKINILNTCLTTLEIRGIIKRLPGGMVALS